MVRPRWHDALIVSAIVGLLAVGVWSLWGEGSAPPGSAPSTVTPIAAPIAAGTGRT